MRLLIIIYICDIELKSGILWTILILYMRYLFLVMLFVLLSRLDNRFGKIEKELNEIKKRMEDYLKVQQKMTTEEHKPKEEILVKETEAVPLMSQMTEHVTVVKAATTRDSCSGKTRIGY